MKNTQKKLKAKHFRYLSKDIIKNPMIYIRNFYRYKTDITNWRNHINLFVQAGGYPEMANTRHAENGFQCKQMIEQIEVAYVIFKQCRIPKQAYPLQFVAQREDYSNYILHTEYTRNGKRDVQDIISKFFSYQSLDKWYRTMDELMTNMSKRESDNYDKFGDKILAIKELLIRLAFALHYIYEDEHLLVLVPPYVKADPTPAHDTTDPLSKLGELVHVGIGEQYEEKEKTLDKDQEQQLPLSCPSKFHPKKRVTVPPWLAPQPYSTEALRAFFDKDDLLGWRDNIRNWYQAIIAQEQYWSTNRDKRFSGANLLYLYSCIHSFLEMFFDELTDDHIVQQDSKSKDTLAIFQETPSIHIHHKNGNIVFYYIDSTEIENPFNAILNSLQPFSNYEWEEILYAWLEYGLSHNGYSGKYHEYSTFIYQSLTKIIELSYILAFADEIEFIIAE
ncbi:hypothetical protein [Sphingobacterium sp. SYP-B4668]|uniref:hypothetical protein n=1 Tax=Sphingobacterium sp. SYP-B4668 TaxID=2996035 RepID=UPI0022DE0459|nr:hypothetical protein [Sphingobacterium sp. SYP-B4668]